MKTTSLLFGTFLLLLTGGCVSDNYGPASPDYYPEYSMGLSAMPKPLPAPAKATAARALPADIQAARAPDLSPAVRS
jgi:hypothetical protein